MDYVRSEWGMIEHSRRELEDARQEGHAQGHEEGLTKGREEERRILIKSLYDDGMAIETTAASVGLPEPAIRRLLDDE